MGKYFSVFLNNFKEDFIVFNLVRKESNFLKYLYYPDFRTVFIFRLSTYLYNFKITRPLAYLLTMMNDLIAGVWIGPTTQIKAGLFLGNSRGLVINSTAKIGTYCSIMQNVAIGGPNVTIGDNVEINAGASIISNARGKASLSIGNNVIIGAGAVVIKDVPDCSVVIGVPGKIIKKITPNDNWIAFRKSRNQKTMAISKDE